LKQNTIPKYILYLQKILLYIVQKNIKKLQIQKFLKI